MEVAAEIWFLDIWAAFNPKVQQLLGSWHSDARQGKCAQKIPFVIARIYLRREVMEFPWEYVG